MNILVTGGTGYIGSHTCIQLIQAGITPIILDNLYNSKKLVLERIAQVTGVTPQFYQGDIGDSELLERIFAQHEIASVVHFAGLKAVGESVEKPLMYYQNNVAGTLNLVQAMDKARVKSLIFQGKIMNIPVNKGFPIPSKGTLDPSRTSLFCV